MSEEISDYAKSVTRGLAVSKSPGDRKLDAIEAAAKKRDEGLRELDAALLSAHASGVSYREMARAAGYLAHSFIYDRIQTLLREAK